MLNQITEMLKKMCDGYMKMGTVVHVLTVVCLGILLFGLFNHFNKPIEESFDGELEDGMIENSEEEETVPESDDSTSEVVNDEEQPLEEEENTEEFYNYDNGSIVEAFDETSSSHETFEEEN